MKYSDFIIGTEFWFKNEKYKCVDKGTKFVCASPVNRVDIGKIEYLDPIDFMNSVITFNQEAQKDCRDALDEEIAKAESHLQKLKEQKAERDNPCKCEQPENHGKPWTNDNIQCLKICYELGHTVENIANNLKRSEGSVISKLQSLGYTEFIQGIGQVDCKTGQRLSR